MRMILALALCLTFSLTASAGPIRNVINAVRPGILIPKHQTSTIATAGGGTLDSTLKTFIRDTAGNWYRLDTDGVYRQVNNPGLWQIGGPPPRMPNDCSSGRCPNR